MCAAPGRPVVLADHVQERAGCAGDDPRDQQGPQAVGESDAPGAVRHPVGVRAAHECGPEGATIRSEERQALDAEDGGQAGQTVGREAGVVEPHPHRRRHTFVTNLLEGGTDVRLVQELLDHADLSTTALYTKASDERTAGAVMGLKTFPPTGTEPSKALPLIGPGSVPAVDDMKPDAASS